MYQRILTIKEFLGLNNIDPPERIPPVDQKPAFLTASINVDIDDMHKPTTRGGYADPVYHGSGIHSGFCYLDTCLFIEGAALKKLNPPDYSSTVYSSTVIRDGVGSARMHYVGVQDRIYFTNESIIEYYDRKDGQVHQFSDPNQTYKSRMVPGYLIEWYRGRLYVARRGQVWASDPAAPHQTDTRRNFKNLGGYITLLRAVRDGMFVSNGRETYFLSGEFTEWEAVRVDEHPAIAGMDVRIDGEFVGARGFPTWVIVWLSTHGVFVGMEGGKVFNVTKDFYRPDLDYAGAAMWRKIVKAKNQQFYQYVVSQKIMPDVTIDASAAPFVSTTSMSASISIA